MGLLTKGDSGSETREKSEKEATTLYFAYYSTAIIGLFAVLFMLWFSRSFNRIVGIFAISFMIFTLVCCGGVLNDVGKIIALCIDKASARKHHYESCFTFTYSDNVENPISWKNDGYNVATDNDKAMFAGAIMYCLFSSLLTITMFSKMNLRLMEGTPPWPSKTLCI